MMKLNQLDGEELLIDKDQLRVVEVNRNGKGSVITLTTESQFIVSQDPATVLELWKVKEIA